MAPKPNLSEWIILVIDDDPHSIILIESVFTLRKANVYSATSGLEALEKLETMPLPKVILCDIRMPYMDGTVLLKKIRDNSLFDNTPIIAVTALAMVGDRDRILAAGFDGYISKPFQVGMIAHEIMLIVQKAKLSSGVQ